MNFDEINKIYSHMRKAIYPNVKCVWNKVSTEEILIDRYLSSVDDNTTYKLLAMPFLVNAEEYLKRYKEKCIIYYNTPEPADGLMLFLHQISPSVHVHSRLFCWVENNEVYDYITCMVFHKKSEDAVKFIDSSFDIARKGNTEEKPAGFGFK